MTAQETLNELQDNMNRLIEENMHMSAEEFLKGTSANVPDCDDEDEEEEEFEEYDEWNDHGFRDSVDYYSFRL